MQRAAAGCGVGGGAGGGGGGGAVEVVVLDVVEVEVDVLDDVAEPVVGSAGLSTAADPGDRPGPAASTAGRGPATAPRSTRPAATTAGRSGPSTTSILPQGPGLPDRSGSPPSGRGRHPAIVLRDELTDALRTALVAVGVEPPAEIRLERPARREHGDWSSNVALASAKAAGRNPRELGRAVVDRLNAHLPTHVTRAELAGPGFVNLHLADSWLHEVLVEVVESGPDGWARPDVGGGRRVNVEFVSANPTGPVHAGHARGACYGDAVARMLERTGHVVHREFYINDRGAQLAAFGASIAARAAGQAPPEDGYHGGYIAEWAEALGEDEDPSEFGYARALADQREVLGRLGVVFDTWTSERALVASGAMEATLADLRSRGEVYDEDGAVWLRTSNHGDDKDRVLVRSDGEPTYFLPDIAYHRDKFARGWQLLIDVWGADHHGYVARMRAALQILGHDPAEFEVQITQLVKLERGGEEVKISKRTGDIIELRELLDEVGADAVRLTYLLQSIDSRQTVDLGVLVEESMDNPVYYVQMAHARLAGIVRRAGEAGVVRSPLASVDLPQLGHERELDLLRCLAELPDVLAVAVADRAPHRVTTWVRELAGAVHRFYHDCYVVAPSVPPELTQARLWLVEAARVGLVVGLDLLGVHAPDRMD
jgi:arginyl-tRNA synthetase